MAENEIARLQEKKAADPDHDVLEVISQRWSPTTFSDRPVGPEKLCRLFEAARWAPSSFNEQPWAFFVATKDDQEAHQNILPCFNEKNQQWAKRAPVIGLSCVKRLHDKNDKPNRVAQHDTGLAMGNLLAQATAEGLHVRQAEGIDLEASRQRLRLPDRWDPVAGFAIGYLGQPDRPLDEVKQRERHPLGEFVFRAGWGETSPLVQGGGANAPAMKRPDA